jgi:hypothetical protein
LAARQLATDSHVRGRAFTHFFLLDFRVICLASVDVGFSWQRHCYTNFSAGVESIDLVAFQTDE